MVLGTTRRHRPRPALMLVRLATLWTMAPCDSCGRRGNSPRAPWRLRNYKTSNTEPLQISGSRVTKRLLGLVAAFAISPFRTGARQHGGAFRAELKLVTCPRNSGYLISLVRTKAERWTRTVTRHRRKLHMEAGPPCDTSWSDYG